MRSSPRRRAARRRNTGSLSDRLHWYIYAILEDTEPLGDVYAAAEDAAIDAMNEFNIEWDEDDELPAWVERVAAHAAEEWREQQEVAEQERENGRRRR